MRLAEVHNSVRCAQLPRHVLTESGANSMFDGLNGRHRLGMTPQQTGIG